MSKLDVVQTCSARDAILSLAESHRCSKHALFDALESVIPTPQQSAVLLRNYDAHASVLRRLLLQAATFMPEAAVGYVLENVRNEYGNGNYDNNHQHQLQDVAWRSGVSKAAYEKAPIKQGVRTFIQQATCYYQGRQKTSGKKLNRAAIAAGAITATEILAIKEFAYLQKAFSRIGLGHHIWFDHVTIEAQHTDESLSLALYFAERSQLPSLLHGLQGILDANVFLYDGLLAAVQDQPLTTPDFRQ